MKDKRTYSLLEIFFDKLCKNEYVTRLFAWSIFRHDIIKFLACWLFSLFAVVITALAYFDIITFTTAVIIGITPGGLVIAFYLLREIFLLYLDKYSIIRREMHEIMATYIKYRCRDKGKIGMTTEEHKKFIKAMNRIKDHFKN